MKATVAWSVALTPTHWPPLGFQPLRDLARKAKPLTQGHGMTRKPGLPSSEA